ncbi:hypothetical protein HGA88_06865 [Candidatus Roizmanbacteria bacterium]|nr:hypothetical protein [Candidatus Roizmanbacteria bacterium]
MSHAPITIPELFIQTVNKLYGAKAELWLNNLPKTIVQYAQKQNVTLGTPLSFESIHLILNVQNSQGHDLLLKIGYPQDAELQREARALKIYNGEGAVRLLYANCMRGWA